MIFIKSCSTFSGAVSFVSSSRRDNRITCVSTTTPTAIPYHDPSTTFPVFRATPGSRQNLLHRLRNLPPKLLRHHPRRALNRLRLVPKKSRSPNQLLNSGREAAAIAFGVGNALNNAGVTRFTRTSVHCADRIVATVSSHAFL